MRDNIETLLLPVLGVILMILLPLLFVYMLLVCLVQKVFETKI